MIKYDRLFFVFAIGIMFGLIISFGLVWFNSLDDEIEIGGIGNFVRMEAKQDNCIEASSNFLKKNGYDCEVDS